MRYSISNLQKYRRLLLFGALTFLLTLVAGSMHGPISGTRSSGVSAQELSKLNRFIQSSDSQDEAMKIFKKGRDQIEDGNWNLAAATFNSFIDKYPRHKDVDAALYWKAFALKNQKKYAEADSNLDRLFSEYPKSNWIDDAKAMRLEIDGQTGKQGGIVEVLKPGSQGGGSSASDIEIKMIALQSLFQSNPERAAEYAAAMLKPDSTSDRRLKEIAISLLGQHRVPATTTLLIEIAQNQPDPKLRKNAIFWVGQGGSDAAVDALMKLYDTEQNDEIKGQILFSLSQNNNPRARSKLREIASSSGSNIELRKKAIFGLSQRGGDASVDELKKIFDADSNTEIRKQVLFALRQIHSQEAQLILVRAAQEADNAEVRKQAIFWIGQGGNDEAVDALMKLYDAEQNDEIKGQILFSLSQNNNPRALAQHGALASSSGSNIELRKKAIFGLSQRGGDASVDELSKIFDADSNTEIRKQVLFAFSQFNNPRAQAKMLEIARTAEDFEVRKQAIFWIGQRAGDQAINTLSQLYDSEKDMRIKEQLIFAFGQSRQNAALQKLMQIGKSDASVELRKKAIFWLGQSRDPQAAKFIEEILK